MKVKKMLKSLEDINPKASMLLHNDKITRKVVDVKTNDKGDVVYFVDFSYDFGFVNYKGLTLEEIITKLKKLNPEAELRFHSEDGPLAYFLYLYAPNTKYVLLKGEKDTNMANEIGVMFYDLQYDENATELDVYKELLECGITVEKFGEIYGPSEAYEMETICKKHGLL